MEYNTIQETVVELNGKVYTLVLDLNAQCLFEKVTGKNFYLVATSKERTTAVEDRAMFWCMLQREHKEVTIEEAGSLLTLLVQILPEEIQNRIAEQMRLSQPEPEEGQEVGPEIPLEPTG